MGEIAGTHPQAPKSVLTCQKGNNLVIVSVISEGHVRCWGANAQQETTEASVRVTRVPAPPLSITSLSAQSCYCLC